MNLKKCHDLHPKEVDELSRKRGGKIRRRSDGGRRQQPVHAQSHVDAQVTGPHMAWSSLLQPRHARPAAAGAARGGVEGRRSAVAAAHVSPPSTAPAATRAAGGGGGGAAGGGGARRR